MAILSDKQIREKIASRLLALYPDAKILKRNPYTQPRDKWAGMFKHEYPASSGLIVTHAWFIRRSRVEALASRDDAFQYQIMVGKGVDYGVDAINSEDDFQDSLDDLTEALKDSQTFFGTFAGTTDEIVAESLIWEPIGIIKIANTEFLHFADARLRLKVIRC